MNRELTEEEKAFCEAVEARIKQERKRQEQWEGLLFRLAKYVFEKILGVKKGDFVNMGFISNRKVIYDDVCMDNYGNLKIRCYHLKKDGTPRKNPSYEQWGEFYDNEIKYKPEKESDKA